MSLSKLFIRPVTFAATEDSTSPNSDSSVAISGGLSVSKKIQVGDDIVTFGSIDIQNEENSIDITTGSFRTKGGAAFAKTVTIGGVLDMSTNNIVGIADPTNPSDAVHKSYVDNLVNDPVQSQITTLGTLTHLTVSGSALFTQGSDVTSPYAGGSALFSGGVGIGSTLWIGGSQGVKLLDNIGPMLTKDVNRFTTGIFTGTGRSGLFYESDDWITLGTANLGSSVSNGVQIVSYNENSTYTKWLSVWSFNGTVSLHATTDTFSGTTGALLVSGGASISKSLWIDNTGSSGAGLNISHNETTSQIRLYGSGSEMIPQNVINTTTDGRLHLFSESGFIAEARCDTANDFTNIQLANDVSVSQGYVHLFLNSSKREADGGQNTCTIRNDIGDLCLQAKNGVNKGLRIYSSDNNVAIITTTTSNSPTTGALQVIGGVGVQGSLFLGTHLNVAGTTTLTGAVTVPAPTGTTHATTKAYVDEATYLSAGTGLSKSDSTFSVNASQPQITSIGEINSTLRIRNPNSESISILRILNNNPSDTALSLWLNGSTRIIDGGGNAASLRNNLGELRLQSKGGNGLVIASDTGNVMINGTVSASNLGNIATKDLIDWNTDIVNRPLVQNIQAGTGLTLSNNILSVNTAQDQIISLGTLTGLTSSGVVSVTNSTASNSSTTGAFRVTGGVGVQGSLFLGTHLNVTGTTTLTGAVTVPAPTGTTHATTKAYVDGATYLTAGTGLSKSGSTFSVNAAQSQITSLGTLTALNSSGIVTFTNTTQSTSTITGALRISGGVGIQRHLNVGGNITAANLGTLAAKDVVDWETDVINRPSVPETIQAGTGLTLDINTNTLSVNADQNQITSLGTLTELSSSGIVSVTNPTASNSNTTGALRVTGGVGVQGSLFLGTNLNVAGTTTLTGTVTVPVPTANAHATTKAYVDGATYLTAGTGLTKSGSTFSVNAAQNQITSLGTLTGLTSSGIVSVTDSTASNSNTTGALRVTGGVGVQGSLFLGTNLNVAGTTTLTGTVTVPVPTANAHATTKAYVDGATYLTAGTGLTRVGSTISVDAVQDHITSVGTLGGLTITGLLNLTQSWNVVAFSCSGIINITSTSQSTGITSGSLRVAGGAGISRNLHVGGNIVCNGDITAFSDARLKDNIETIHDAVFMIKRMRGVRYVRKDNNRKKGMGLIAQEVQDIIPEVVLKGGDHQGTLSIAYGNIVGVLVEALKQTLTRTEKLESTVSHLEQQILTRTEKLESTVSDFEQMFNRLCNR
jgi:hypothetical protein